MNQHFRGIRGCGPVNTVAHGTLSSNQPQNSGFRALEIPQTEGKETIQSERGGDRPFLLAWSK